MKPVDPHRPTSRPHIEDIPRRDRPPMFPEQGECYLDTGNDMVYEWFDNWHAVAPADDPFWFGQHTPDWKPFR